MLIILLKLVTAFMPKFDDLIHATKTFNKSKNRDPNLLPVSVKRVVLPAKPGVDGSDYINATYLQVSLIIVYMSVNNKVEKKVHIQMTTKK